MTGSGALSVFDAAGQLVFEGRLPGNLDLNVKNWQPGSYVVVLRSGNAVGRAVFLKS